MPRYSIIFSDIDGTLVDSHHRIPPQTRAIIRRLREVGVRFVPVSARPPAGIRLILDELGMPAPMVAYSGALLLDEEGRTLCEQSIPAGEAERLWALLGAEYPALSRSLYAGCDWYTDRPADPWIAQEMEITQTAPLPMEPPERIPEGRTIHKIMCMGDPAQIDALFRELQGGFPRLGIQKSKPTYLEITTLPATKASGVRLCCERFGLPIGEAAALGDNFNDLDMLQAVGLGIAMGNAPAEVQARAGRVTASNDAEGVYHALAALFPELA